MQEYLIQGYQKENEKLTEESKALKKQVDSLNERLYDQNKKVTQIETRLAHDSGNYILTDKELNIEAQKFIGKEHLIDKNQLKEAQDKIIQLQDQITSSRKVTQDKEIELKQEIDRLRKRAKELEEKLGGVNIQEIKKDNEQYERLQKSLDDTKHQYESELKDLRSKLSWYIENHESLVAKEEALKEKDVVIKNLQEDVSQILNDPTTNLDAKSKHFTRLMNSDKSRIKKLERQIEELEDSLKRRNPTTFDKYAKDKEESQVVKDMRARVKTLETERETRELEFETKLKDFKADYDKMQLRFEQKAATGKVTKMTPDQDPAVLKKRIKDLEKEVEDAKTYYLKKAKNLSTTVKPPSKSRAGLAKASAKTTSSAKKEDQDSVVDETEIKPTSSVITASLSHSEKLNIANNIIQLPNSYLFSFVNDFNGMKTNVLQNLGVQSVAQKELDSFKDKMLRVYQTAGNIDDDTINMHLQDVGQILRKEGREKFTELKAKLEELTEEINDYVWCRLKNSKPLEVMPGKREKENAPLMGNFVTNEGPKQPNPSADKENAELKATIEKTRRDLERTRKEKAALEHILQDTPKNPRALDFVTLEKKLDIMEKNYRQNELEMKNAFKTLFFKDVGLDEEQIAQIRSQFDKELGYYRSIIENKNTEIMQFRKEIAYILQALQAMKQRSTS